MPVQQAMASSVSPVSLFAIARYICIYLWKNYEKIVKSKNGRLYQKMMIYDEV